MGRSRCCALAIAALLAGPGSALAAARTHVVTLRDLAFTRVPAKAQVGDVVQWVNADVVRHSATARDRSFDVDLPPKAQARTVLRRAGAVSFYCRYHPGMTGRIQVAGPGGSSGR
jgi:plastocyanin